MAGGAKYAGAISLIIALGVILIYASFTGTAATFVADVLTPQSVIDSATD